MRVDVEIEGAKQAVANLSGIGERAGDPRPAMRLVRDILAKGVAKQYTSKGSYLDQPWSPNRPGTLARKVRLGQGSEPLTASGALGTALQGGSGKRHRVTRTSASVGTSLWYAHFAQTGTERAEVRTIMGIKDTDNSRAVRCVERFILDGRLA